MEKNDFLHAGLAAVYFTLCCKNIASEAYYCSPVPGSRIFSLGIDCHTLQLGHLFKYENSQIKAYLDRFTKKY